MRLAIRKATTVFGIVALLAAPAMAQDASTKERVQRNAQRGSSVGQLDSKTKGTTVRASQLLGLNVYDAEGEGIAEIKDIVLDANSGRVLYAAVTYGGIFGLGDKLFAVPFKAFHVKQERDNPDDVYLTLNVTEKQLDGAQGFDQDNWPNFADENFVSELNRRYNVKADQQNRNLRERLESRENRVEEVEIDIERE
ncbi:PRC-barrel domain protein [Stieleria maiorica]|uniref:PRC-barrel domain protein n=1 Tax=Stieleria maiorica TaxID=2795974 RepID=A0A5B9MIK8_9BACT|nr:PRC-barrel domain-containing protein [Stieleria maiorica]QEG01193.1 PRC-barrel domain protein [Stieleria maiorica]